MKLIHFVCLGWKEPEFSSNQQEPYAEFTCYLYISVKFDDETKQKADDQLLNNIDENVVMNALDGFLIILSTDGDVIYVSENIHDHIGIQQVCS